jgi:hypothetical protein
MRLMLEGQHLMLCLASQECIIRQPKCHRCSPRVGDGVVCKLRGGFSGGDCVRLHHGTDGRLERGVSLFTGYGALFRKLPIGVDACR